MIPCHDNGCQHTTHIWLDGIRYFRGPSVSVSNMVCDEQLGEWINQPHQLRKFDTGATRNIDALRDDPEGYLSPLVLDRYNEYMTKNRVQADGSIRASDNWQLGIPLEAYIKGLWRHFLHLWQRHRGWPVRDSKASLNAEEDCCAILFNTQGYLHELIKKRLEVK